MKIKDLMIKPVFISSNATKKDLIRIARKHPQTMIFIVVNKNKNFLGDIHENDLFVMLMPNEMYDDLGVEVGFDFEKKFFAKYARELMRKHDIVCYVDDDVSNIGLKFSQAEVNEMPVLNKKKQVVGVITQGILLRHMNVTKSIKS
jgi:CBS domain-containing protein